MELFFLMSCNCVTRGVYTIFKSLLHFHPLSLTIHKYHHMHKLIRAHLVPGRVFICVFSSPLLLVPTKRLWGNTLVAAPGTSPGSHRDPQTYIDEVTGGANNGCAPAPPTPQGMGERMGG